MSLLDEHIILEAGTVINDLHRVSERLARLVEILPSPWHRAALTREHPANLERLVRDLEVLQDSFRRHTRETACD